MIMGPPRLPMPVPPERVESPRVAALTAGGAEAFWAEVDRCGTPLVEELPGDPGHRAVTFLWRGEAGVVLALVNRLSDPLNLAASAMARVPGTDVWHLTYRLRDDHRASYRIAVGAAAPPADPAGAQRYLAAVAADAGPDPRAPWSVPLRWGDGRASVFELPGAPDQPWRPWLPDGPGAARGTVTRHRVPAPALGGDREVWLYEPPGGAGAPDLLVLLDGDLWFGKTDVAALFDRLVAAGTVPPLTVLAPHAVDTPTRMRELGPNAAFTAFLTEDLLPWAARRTAVTDDPARTVLAGESLGGLTALHAAFEAPDRFGRVLAQSASLWWNPAGDRERTPWLTERFAREPARDLRIHLRVGRHEWAMLDEHRELDRTLRMRGYPVRYTEYNGGHDYACWAGGLAEGLTALLGS